MEEQNRPGVFKATFKHETLSVLKARIISAAIRSRVNKSAVDGDMYLYLSVTTHYNHEPPGYICMPVSDIPELLNDLSELYNRHKYD